MKWSTPGLTFWLVQRQSGSLALFRSTWSGEDSRQDASSFTRAKSVSMSHTRHLRFHRIWRLKPRDLVHDLEYISAKLCGEYTLTEEAIDWGSTWYRFHFEEGAKKLDPVRFGGYIARKQTMAHKLAIILAASQRDELIITRNDLQTSVEMITDLEPDMGHVFEKIGMKEDSVQLDRLIQTVRKRGSMSYTEVYAWMQRYFPHKTQLSDVLDTAISAGNLFLTKNGQGYLFSAYPEVASKAVDMDQIRLAASDHKDAAAG